MHRNKRRSEKCYVLIKKRRIKGEKRIAPMDFAEHLENQTFQRIAYLYGRFLRNGLHERYYISKGR